MFEKIENWMDGELLGYRRGYILTHPLKFYHGISNEIKWAYQRVFRGWDDRVIWSIDHYLAKNIPVWVKALKDNNIGIPMRCFDDDDINEWDWSLKPGANERGLQKWNKIQDDIILGFNAYIEMCDLSIRDPKIEELKKAYKHGFDMFQEYFNDLWD